MAGTTLTDARVRALRPRKTARDVRDGKLKGFGIRVLPSGRNRFFIHCQHEGERVWKIVGDAAEIRVDEARTCARGMLASIRRGEGVSGAGETRLEDFAETVFLQTAYALGSGGTRCCHQCRLFQARQTLHVRFTGALCISGSCNTCRAAPAASGR